MTRWGSNEHGLDGALQSGSGPAGTNSSMCKYLDRHTRGRGTGNDDSGKSSRDVDTCRSWDGTATMPLGSCRCYGRGGYQTAVLPPTEIEQSGNPAIEVRQLEERQSCGVMSISVPLCRIAAGCRPGGRMPNVFTDAARRIAAREISLFFIGIAEGGEVGRLIAQGLHGGSKGGGIR